MFVIGGKIVDLRELKLGLEKSLKIYEEISHQKEVVVKEEIEQLEKLIDYLEPVLPKKIINGKKAYLIYVFAESKKKTVSPDVYFCEDGNIRYQVYLKEDYRSYNPTVEYEGPYAVVDAKDMFSKRNGLEFADIVEFFIERVESLREMAENTEEATQVRKRFLKNYTKLTRGL